MTDRACTPFLLWALRRLERRWAGYRKVPSLVGKRLSRRLHALGFSAYPVGAFEDARVAEVLRLGRSEAPLHLVPVGAPRFATVP